jgi:hypothetical protein
MINMVIKDIDDIMGGDHHGIMPSLETFSTMGNVIIILGDNIW